MPVMLHEGLIELCHRRRRMFCFFQQAVHEQGERSLLKCKIDGRAQSVGPFCSRREKNYLCCESRWSGANELMKSMNRMNSHLTGFSSGASLGGTVSRYHRKQNIYKQGSPAFTLFYIHEGGVRLTTRTKRQPSAVTAILGANDFFGELCLADYPLRMSSAVALSACSIRTIEKAKMLQILRKGNKASNSLVAYLLTSIQKYQAHVADLLTFSAEQRLARMLLHLAHLDGKGPAITEIPILSHEVLAEMVGTTRPRVNLFMNRFRRKGFISYDGGLEVHRSLRKVLANG